MKKYILIYRHLLVLLWEILIIVIFKFINNFKFKNGEAIVFTILFFIFPVVIYIWSFIRIHKIRINHNVKIKGYFEGIKKDERQGALDINLINHIESLGFNVEKEIYDTYILLILKKEDKALMTIEFNQLKAKLTILNTLVIYRYYYSYVTGEFTKYDLRNFEYKEIQVLYNAIYDTVNHLNNNEYLYIQKHHTIKLTRKDINKDIYVRKTQLLFSPKISKEKRIFKL